MDIDDFVIVMAFILGQHDVDTILQRLTTWEGKQGVLPHRYRMARSRFAEELHVHWQREKQTVLFADAIMFVAVKDGDDHTATGIFLSSFSYS